jgi:hypothetical protein
MRSTRRRAKPDWPQTSCFADVTQVRPRGNARRANDAPRVERVRGVGVFDLMAIGVVKCRQPN